MSACAICLTTEVSVGGKNSCVTECGHIFCLSCILRASQENTACPLCRNVLIPPKNDEEHANNLAEEQRAYVRGYERGRVDLEEEHAEELNIRVQEEFDRGFINGRRNADEEILSLRREISRIEGLLSFERIKTEASAAALAAPEQTTPEQTNPRAEAHGAPWQS
tara:strand:- start:187 stop:681 length:495 start_codon:yes stop_codon:yes gene_type:complete